MISLSYKEETLFENKNTNCVYVLRQRMNTLKPAITVELYLYEYMLGRIGRKIGWRMSIGYCLDTWIVKSDNYSTELDKVRITAKKLVDEYEKTRSVFTGEKTV